MTGRHSDGSPLHTTFSWPDNPKPISLKLPSQAIRYLGAHITLDCQWTAHIRTMEAAVMTLVASLKHRKLSTLQGALLYKEVIVQKLDIGLRHASIPTATLAAWDRSICNSLTTSCDLVDKGTIHP
jgi:hypothetical protein